MNIDLIPWRSILLPDKGRICLASRADLAYERLSFHDRNHNLFRLDAAFNVVWQVQRDERGALNLEGMNAGAKMLGIRGGHLSGYEPFTVLSLEYEGGSTNVIPSTGS